MESALTNIGELDTRIIVQECVITTGAVAQKRYTFGNDRVVWAKLTRNIDESVVLGNLDQQSSVTATIYKIDGMTTRWRVLIDGVPYSITAIDPISRYSRLCRLTLTSNSHGSL